MTDESTLLRRFVTQHCQASFAELVQRHLGLVYHSALRQTEGDTLLAEDAAQATFLLVAEKAAKLCDHPELAGWLYTTACHKARELRRGEARRHRREQAVSTMNETHREPTNDEAWNRVRPLIDDALLELAPADRTAVLLRHFEGRSYSEVGAALQLGENAARMRVDRALDRLQASLTKRGIVSSGTALAAVLTVPAALAVPAGLAGKITGVALAAGAAGGGAVATVSFFHLMNSTKIFALAAGLAGAAAIGTAIHCRSALNDTRAESAALREELAGAQSQVRDLQGLVAGERKRTEAAEQENSRLRARVEAFAARSASDPDAQLTRDSVNERFRQGMAWVREGKWEAGLAELLWCYDVGMVRISALTNTRNTALLYGIADLGEKYPPALAALRERRDAQENRVLAPNCGLSTVLDYAALNDVLGDGEKTLVVYDTMASSDERKAVLGGALLKELLEARRYSEAVRQYPDGMLLARFEAIVTNALPPAGPGAERPLSREQRIACETACQHIEALAGAGDLAQAGALIEKLLAADGTLRIRESIGQHLARAGHPELLAP